MCFSDWASCSLFLSLSRSLSRDRRLIMLFFMLLLLLFWLPLPRVTPPPPPLLRVLPLLPLGLGALGWLLLDAPEEKPSSGSLRLKDSSPPLIPSASEGDHE